MLAHLTTFLILLAIGDAAAWLQKRASEVPTLSPTTFVKGKAFDRIAIIWLENTDYDKAIGDRKYAVCTRLGSPLTPRGQPCLACFQGRYS